MKNYYFTYGTDGHPFVGGWTKIEAPNRQIAIDIFNSIHPKKSEFVNCSSIYDEEEFHKTSMWRNGNYGKHEVEVVLMQHFVIDGYIDELSEVLAKWDYS